MAKPDQVLAQLGRGALRARRGDEAPDGPQKHHERARTVVLGITHICSISPNMRSTTTPTSLAEPDRASQRGGLRMLIEYPRMMC